MTNNIADNQDTSDLIDPVLEMAFSVSDPVPDQTVIEKPEKVEKTQDTIEESVKEPEKDSVDDKRPTVNSFELDTLQKSGSRGANLSIPNTVLGGISVDVSVQLGRVAVNLNELYALQEGQIIELDREVGDALDVIVNGQVIAKCEIVVLNYNYAIRITELVGTLD